MTSPALPGVRALADQLAPAIASAAHGTTAWWQITGPATAGKSTLLSSVRAKLCQQGLKAILLAPPQGSFDTPGAALVQLAEGLSEHGLVNGELAAWREPGSFASKLATARRWIDAHAHEVVLLLDEPERWPSRSAEDARFGRHATEVVRALIEGARCRRVVAGSITAAAWPIAKGRRFHLERTSNPEPWLREEIWGVLRDAARTLWDHAGASLARLSPLDIRLLVGITAASSVDEAVRCLHDPIGRRGFARTLATLLESDARLLPVTRAWARLALLRGPFSRDLLRVLEVDVLPEAERAVVLEGLLYEDNGNLVLHETLRLDAMERQWLGGAEERAWHRHIAQHYAASFQAHPSMLHEMEAFYHATRAADADLLAELRPFFSDQLDAMGRELSRTNRNYSEAVRVFERSLEWDAENDYAHHYVAFNLDVQGKQPVKVEKHYQRAIELDPENVWWRSRWVSYLVTRGRSLAARAAWDDALDALGLPDPDVPPEIYEHLHVWVARLLVHRGQLDFASDVLRGIPPAVKHRHPGLRSLARLLDRLIQARSGRAVLPLTIAEPDWWTGPHLSALRNRDGAPLVRWMPGRIDAIDEGRIHLVVATLPSVPASAPEYGHIEISFADFDRASRDERAAELSAGRFVELSFYGDAPEPIVRVHRARDWEERNLPPLFPDPVRYLRADERVR